MTDHELLELAAKAAGYEWRWEEQSLQIKQGDLWVCWSSLADNKDALLLARLLRIAVYFDPGISYAEYKFPEGAKVFSEPWGDDDMKACRLAITKAAAEIGARMD